MTMKGTQVGEEVHQTTTRTVTRQVSEFRTVVLELPSSAPEVPLPYGAGLLVPTHIRIKYDHQYGSTPKTTASARVFGNLRVPGEGETTRLVDAEFRYRGHWVPDWVSQIMLDTCPVGWELPR
ncbi:hypothetical protein [Streptomyces sp. NPDC056069]|uniref:hypothetical protein n=1 Tax=Streptomyces sp. NPDC056069 TaxID=3345702 RepID=UPI0035DF76F8